MDQQIIKSWDKLLNPEKLKESLIKASLFLSAYEILKESIIDRPQSFFTDGCHLDEKTGELKGKNSKSYKDKVISLYPKDEFHACCLWFKEQGAINDSDLTDIAEARKHRNHIAHELPKYISSIDHDVNKRILESLVEVVRKVDVWWVCEIEIPTSPDFEAADMENIDFENIIGGNTMFLNLILSIFEGDDSHLKEIHALLMKKINQIN